MKPSQTLYSPLPTHWPIRGAHYGERISTLPTHYQVWALDTLRLHPALRAALRAEQGFRVMARDQTEGR